MGCISSKASGSPSQSNKPLHSFSYPQRMLTAASKLSQSSENVNVGCFRVFAGISIGGSDRPHEEDVVLFIKIPEFSPSPPSCGWLLGKVAEELVKEGCTQHVAGLKLRNGDQEVIDAMLMDPDRSLAFLKPQDELEVVFANPSGSSQGARNVTFSDFRFVKTIGEGASCSVALVRKKDSGKLYAVKMMPKSRILGCSKSIDRLITERMVLMKSRHPFIIQAPWCFQTKTHLMFVLEFCAGGELFFHLKRRGRFSEDEARFYFSELVLALKYLHLQGVVYRDLKPENILLDLDGHIRLTDFGLSKKTSPQKNRRIFPDWTYAFRSVPEAQAGFTSFAGTPHYMAPEVLKREEYGRSVDFYSLGCLLFVMLTGSFPHFSGCVEEMLVRKVSGEELQYPPEMSALAKNLVDGLCHPDPSKRLGAAAGTKEVEKHPWLESVDWRRLYERKLVPPIDPSTEGSNFDQEFTTQGVPEAIQEHEHALEADTEWLRSKGESTGQKVHNFSYALP